MIFLTGATGLVGKFLLKELLNKNLTVKVLIRNESDKSVFEFDTSNVTWVIGNINDVFLLNETLKSVEYVFHCAAIVSYSSKNIPLMDKVNIEGTKNIINAAIENKVSKFCHISSIAALGSSKDPEISENTPFDPNNYNSHYSLTKYLSELEVWRGSEEGLDVVVLNPTIILGPGDWEKSSSKLFKYVFDQHKYFIGGGYNFIDVRDVVEIAIKTTFSDIKNEQFILAGENVEYKVLFEKIAKGFSVKPPYKRAQKWQKKLLYFYSRLRSFFTGKEPLITKDALNKAEKMPNINNSKAKNSFVHTYKTIDETIQWSCAEYLKKH